MKIHSAFLLQVATATIPSLVILSVVPVIRSRLGLDAFAGFAVMVSAIGLLTVLDGGIGRAVTYFVSVLRARVDERRRHAVVLGGLALSVGLGIVVMTVGTVMLGFLRGESFLIAATSIHILLLFYPAFIACSVLRGALEGQQWFGHSSVLQLVHGLVIGIAPLFLIFRAEDLTGYAWAVGFARICLMAALFYASGVVAPRSLRLVYAAGAHSRRLLQYSKWLFLSNIIGLGIVFADRLIVSGYFSSAVVAAYVFPMELVARGQLLVGAFCIVIFPKLVSYVENFSGNDFVAIIADARGLLIGINLLIGFIFLPLMEPLMVWWLGAELAPTAATVALSGLVGLALISSSSISMLAINGMGHTRQVAILHGAELPLYLSLLYLAAAQASLQWLLAAWLFRLACDAFGMELILRRLNIKRFGLKVAVVRRTMRDWVLLLALALILLGLVYFRASISSTVLLCWALGGVASAIAVLVRFGRRLRETRSN